METNESVLLTTRLRDNWIDPHRFFNSSSPSRRRLSVQQRPLPVALFVMHWMVGLPAKSIKEKDESMKSLSGFETAALKDPCIIAAQEVQKMVNLFDKLDTLLKGPIKAKRLASLTSSLAEVKLNPSYKRATIDNLLEGINKTIAIVGKVLYWCVIQTKYALSLLYTGSTKMLRRIPVHQLGKDQWRFFYVLCYFAAPWNTHQV
ncbi:hypothetical protein L2E82_39405 [Cichorium intybus]|uniref:Uncharacterized protein n=1 Tax=Cichorium intybus TaxID=13427 RepID=A0ACB9AHW8_CICIN|nr:hypothetical protein L2E82_39405 [Cichorium intybus]